MTQDHAPRVGSAFETDIYVVEPDQVLGIEAGRSTSGNSHAREAIHAALRIKVAQVISTGAFEPPRLPSVALKVINTAQDPDSNAAGLSALVHKDQFLAVRVLKVANSAAYGPRDRRIFSLPGAIARLGVMGTRNVVLSAAMAQSVYQGPRKRLLQELWRSAVGGAVGFQLIDSVCGKDGDAAFLAGLMQDIGKPVIVRILDELIRVNHAGEADFGTLAPELLHLLHAKLETIIVRSWDAPRGMVDLVAHHHDRFPPRKQTKPVRRLRLANLLYELWERDQSLEELPGALASHSAFARCGMTKEQARTALRRYPRLVSGMLAG